MSVMIETFNLIKKFDNLTAVEDLCIQVNKGEILGSWAQRESIVVRWR